MEGYGPAAYGDRIAEVYDAWYDERLDPTVTVAFLAPLAHGGRALELGIGTGRVALPLRRLGVEVHGIDASEAMVARLLAKPGGGDVPVTIGDFADMPVDGPFRLVYAPFTTFFALESQEQQVRCMQRVHDRLEPGGTFVLDAFVPLHNVSVMDRAGFVTQDVGVDHVLVDAVQHDPLTQTIVGQHIVIGTRGTALYPIRVRYCSPSELDLMAQLAGLTLTDRFESYDGAPFTAESYRHVSVYTRPA
jgi:SAM-dependent methyltransferase